MHSDTHSTLLDDLKLDLPRVELPADLLDDGPPVPVPEAQIQYLYRVPPNKPPNEHEHYQTN
jgi:hypothetical protein